MSLLRVLLIALFAMVSANAMAEAPAPVAIPQAPAAEAATLVPAPAALSEEKKTEIKQEVEKLDIPSGYQVSYEGLYSAQKESSKLLMFISIGVLLALFGILYWHFGSIVLVLQIFLGIVTGWF